MGTILATYPSKTSGSRNYDIIRGNDGVVYCTCWQWKRYRSCRHLEDYLVKFLDTPFGGSNEIEQAIGKAIKELKED